MKNAHQRGFTLLTTIMLVSLATVSSLVLLDVINSDQMDGAIDRRAREARIAAEGGLMEIINDRDVLKVLPTPDSLSSQTTYTPSSDSRFKRQSDGFGSLEYTASIQLVRAAPMLESSHSVVRAVLYEVTVDAEVGGQAGAGIEAEVYKIASSKIGIVRPRFHGR